MMKKVLLTLLTILALATPLMADVCDELSDAINDVEISEQSLREYGYTDAEDFKADLIDQIENLVASY